MPAFVRGVERIGGFGGKSDILATESDLSRRSRMRIKQRLQRLEEATRRERSRSRAAMAFATACTRWKCFRSRLPRDNRCRHRRERGFPNSAPPHELKLPAIHEAPLANGLQILVAERHEIPVVNFWLDVDAGYAADQSATPGTARSLRRCSPAGRNARSALEISDEVQMLGAQLIDGLQPGYVDRLPVGTEGESG